MAHRRADHPRAATTAWLLVVLAGLAGPAGSAHPQPPATPREIGWVGLYHEALVLWLENENRLSELCPPAADTLRWRQCRDEKLRPQEHVLIVRSAPSNSAPVVGSLLVLAVPGRGLWASYRSGSAAPAVEFTPDLFDTDWGYGPHFHQTFLERRGRWFLLPAVPLERPGWVELRDDREPHTRVLNVGDIIVTPWGDQVVTALEEGALRVRAEQAADMWCREGDPPPLEPAAETRLPVARLYDANGHLAVRLKYLRGC